ncbi:MAG: DNA-directed RNA polymerase subunit alpha C-terminal domain-containing protein, partial [Planctomycetota bacterium]
EAAQIHTVAQLVSQEENDLLALRSFGKTSLREIKRKLEEIGLSLGMTLPEGIQIEEPASF